MPHLRDHAAAGCVGLGVFSLTNQYFPGTYSDHLVWGASFLFGNLLPDISNLFYAYVAKKTGHDVDLCRPSTWDEQLFRRIDADWQWFHPYKWLHSLPCWISIYLGVWILYASMVVLLGEKFLPTGITFAFQGVFLGCILHALLDGPTHEDCWLVWPFRLTPQRGVCNWVKVKWLNSKTWRIATLSIIGTAFVTHAAAAWYLVP